MWNSAPLSQSFKWRANIDFFRSSVLNNLRDGLYRKEGTASSLMRAQNLNM